MAQPAGSPAETARKALDLLLSGKYTELAPLFTPEMKTAYPADALAKLRTSFGALKEVDNPSVQPMGANTIVVIPAHFEAKNFNFRFIVNKEGLISGMFPLAGEAAWQRPPYSKPNTFHERDVTVGEDQWKLPATLTIPNGNGPFPAVVLVHGSGPNDRDETKGGTKVFRDLAEGLASRGIATLRYEKRTQIYRSVKPATVDEEMWWTPCVPRRCCADRRRSTPAAFMSWATVWAATSLHVSRRRMESWPGSSCSRPSRGRSRM